MKCIGIATWIVKPCRLTSYWFPSARCRLFCLCSHKFRQNLFQSRVVATSLCAPFHWIWVAQLSCRSPQAHPSDSWYSQVLMLDVLKHLFDCICSHHQQHVKESSLNWLNSPENPSSWTCIGYCWFGINWNTPPELATSQGKLGFAMACAKHACDTWGRCRAR